MKNFSSADSFSDQEVTDIMLEWVTTFMRHSMHDFITFTHSVNLSMVQMNVLMWLYYHHQTEIMRLEDVMQVSRPAASQMVERMVQQGLVTRSESPTDRRSRLVQLSEYGRKLVEESIIARQKWITELMESLSPEQKQSAARVLLLLNQQSLGLDQNRPPSI
jgi:DNA-binding MarR family transcriptional regulator